MSACLLSVVKTNLPVADYPESLQAADDGFRNPVPKPADSVLKTLGLIWNVLLNKPADTVPAAPLPVDTLTRAQLKAGPDRSLFRLGHSTMLIKPRRDPLARIL